MNVIYGVQIQLFFLFFAVPFCNAQKVSTFQKSYGTTNDEFGTSVLALPDKGFLMAGTTGSTDNVTGIVSYKVLIIRTDSMGKQIWAHTYDGTKNTGFNNDPVFNASVDLLPANDGNVVVCTNTGGNGTTSNGTTYFFKINLNGTVLWSHYYSTNGCAVSVCHSPDGGYAMVGTATTISGGNTLRDVEIIKTDSGGSIIWAKDYANANNHKEQGYHIIPAIGGGYLVSGTSDNPKYTLFAQDYLIMKIDNSGKVIWFKVWATNSIDRGYSILELPDKTIYVSGTGGNGQNTLVKFDSLGQPAWAKIQAAMAVLKSMIYDNSKKVINICFEQRGQIGILRTDTSGKRILAKIYSSSSQYSTCIGSNFIKTSSGGFALLQTVYAGANGNDFFLIKMDTGFNTNNCNVSDYGYGSGVFGVEDFSPSVSTKNLTLSDKKTSTESTLTVKDSFYCGPLLVKFNWKGQCIGQTTQFFDSSYYGAISWNWDFGDDSVSTSKNPAHMFSTPGKYNVKLVVRNSYEKDSLVQTVVIYPQPASINYDTLICAGNPIMLHASGGTKYTWRPGRLVSDSNSANPTATLNTTTTFIIKANTAASCVAFDTVHIIVDPKPSATVIQYATVVANNEIDIRFQRSDSNDVKNYEVFRSVNGGAYQIIKTIPNLSNKDSFYMIDDQAVNTTINKYAYKILAVDSCGATSDTSMPHAPMLLNVKEPGCVQTLHLSWTPYTGWKYVKRYNIYRNVNGGADSLIATLNNAITKFDDIGLNHNNLYCYKIVATDSLDSFVSQSNIICGQTFFPDTPGITYVSKTITSTTNGTVVIRWNIINKSHLDYNMLFFSRDGIHFSKLKDPVTLTNKIPIGIDSFVQSGLDTRDSDYYYYLITVDSCSVQSVKSLTSKTMTLIVSVGQLLHKLNWTTYEGFKIKKYKIQRLVNGAFVTVDSVPGTDTFSREFPAPCNYAIRYRIVAEGTLTGEYAWSDTMGRQAIDTIPSDPPVIHSARILSGGFAGLDFTGSDSADSYKFVIQRATNGNWGTAKEILFTKPSDVFKYIDSNVNAKKDQICYTVLTLDSCLNASSSDTICLENLKGNGLFCTKKAQVNWHGLSAPPALPDSLILYRSIDDVNFNKESALTPTTSAYTDTSVLLGQRYYYTISTVYKSGVTSYSDTVKIIPEIIPDADSAQLVYASVVRSDEVKGAIYVKWKRAPLNDTNAIGYYVYSFNSNNGKYTLLKDITDLNDTSFVNTDINTIKDMFKYYILTYNVCNVGINSNIHRTVLLSVKGNNLSEQLNWISYQGVPVKNYSIYKSVDGGSQNLIKTTNTDSNYLDSNIACNHNITYQVQAMLSNGEISFSDSITVKSYDTIKPKTEPLILATVVRTGLTDGKIEIDWNRALDNNLHGYNVYRSVDGFYWSQVAKNYPGTTLIDSVLDTYDHSYYYKIQPVDSCGNTGPYTMYHETIHLKASSGNGFNLVTWNNYIGWPVRKYLLYRDGILMDSFTNHEFEFKDTTVICHTIYLYMLKAIDSLNDTIVSVSNEDSAKAATHISPQKVYIKTVTVSKPNNVVSISWTTSKSYDVKDYLVYRKDFETGDLKLKDSTQNNNYVDSSKYLTRPDCYYVFARDHCGNISDGSNEGCIIILDAKNKEGYNELTWNSYRHWPDGVQSYNVYKNEDNSGWQLIGTSSSVNINQFDDKNLGDSTIDFCYQVEAVENPGQYNQLSRSTVECVHQDATVFIPNSFTPYNQDGVNDLFGPKGIHIKSYDMKIYNRWGECVYSEQIPLAPLKVGSPANETGWDGTFKGETVQQGIYIYMITVTDYNGKQSYFKGTVTLFQ